MLKSAISFLLITFYSDSLILVKSVLLFKSFSIILKITGLNIIANVKHKDFGCVAKDTLLFFTDFNVIQFKNYCPRRFIEHSEPLCLHILRVAPFLLCYVLNSNLKGFKICMKISV